MKTSSFLKIIILLTAMVSMVTGCGSGGSVAVVNTGSNTPSSGTGSISANIVWGGNNAAKSTGKTLYAAPVGVATVRISVFVLDPTTGSLITLITPRPFPADAGIGIIDGIPVGSGRIVRVEGLDAQGYLTYKVEVPNILIELGKVTNVGTVTMIPLPSTSANPKGNTFKGPLAVTLTALPILEPVTIYYTTHSAGAAPPFAQYSGISPVIDIPVYSATTTSLITVILEFFSKNAMGAVENRRTETYTITP